MSSAVLNYDSNINQHQQFHILKLMPNLFSTAASILAENKLG